MKKSLQLSFGFIFVFVFIIQGPFIAQGQLKVTADFDNAHLRAHFSVDPKTNTIDYGKCDMNKDTWYYYKLTGCKGKTITFLNDTCTHVSPVEYRLVSYKPLKTINANSYEMIPVTGKVYTHTFRKNTAWIAWHYVASNDMLDHYIKSISKNPYVSVESIGSSAFFKMPVPLITVTDKSVPDKDKKVVLMISREDSYESNGSVVVMGALQYLLSQDPEAAEIRKHTIYKFMPIFSRDGTRMGHTNWPLNADGSKFVYIPSAFVKNPNQVAEINLFKQWLADWKSSGKTIDIAHSLHDSPYYGTELKFRPGQDLQRAKEMQVLVDSLQARSLTGYRTNTREDTPGFKNYFCQYLYDNFKPVVALNTHSDTRSVSFPGDLKTVEDLYQDGEAFVRGHAVYFGLPLPKSTPPYLYCSKTSRYACSKGDQVTFSVYYKDVYERAPKYIRVCIGNKSYDMAPVEGQKGTLIKGLKYSCTIAVSKANNDFYIEASNGDSKRRVPESYLQNGPWVQ